MRKSIISMLLVLGVAITPAMANKLTVRPDAPQRYVVAKGDTLWGISGRYLKKPWQWPRLWHMNRKEIKNPNLIYPGDVLSLTWVNGEPRLSKVGRYGKDGVIRLSPEIQYTENPIPSIPREKLAAFLRHSQIIDKRTFEHAPVVIAGKANRLVLSTGERLYASGVTEPGVYQVYRPGRMLYDPDTREALGYEAIYGGDVQVDKLEEPVQSLTIVSSKEEILPGNRLIKIPEKFFFEYVPHPAVAGMDGKIIAGYAGNDYGDGEETGLYSNLTINRGSSDGVEIGHVFTIKQAPRVADTGKSDKKGFPIRYTLPQENIGTLLIYRVFDHISYGIVMKSTENIGIGDSVVAPSDDD